MVVLEPCDKKKIPLKHLQWAWKENAYIFNGLIYLSAACVQAGCLAPYFRAIDFHWTILGLTRVQTRWTRAQKSPGYSLFAGVPPSPQSLLPCANRQSEVNSAFQFILKMLLQYNLHHFADMFQTGMPNIPAGSTCKYTQVVILTLLQNKYPNLVLLRKS